jgi:RNA polymerase sigma factor (sigma-70 family)
MVQPLHVRDDALVATARMGDRDALNELARRHLPMVYNLVRQALHDDPDVDDVVQDIMVRAMRQLPELRSTGSFRAWLTAIAVRQIGSHLARENIAARRVAPLEAAIGRAGAEAESLVLLQVELATQRRQVGHATRWMGADDRVVYSLWWLETVGELTRPEVAVALGTGVAHAGVRLQRMREQLELSRKVVAALEAMPGCEVLADVIADWDGVPGPYWRKRIGRHVLTCPWCAPAARPLLPVERLLAGLVLLPVPLTLAKAFLAGAVGGSGAPVAAGVTSWLGRAFHTAAVHPVVTSVSMGVLALGIAVPVVERPTSAPPVRADAVVPHRLPGTGTGTGTPRPSPSAVLLRTGRVSLESASAAGRYIAVAGDSGVLAPAGPRAALHAVAGLAEPSCFSFRGPDGRYLRHSSFRLRLSSDDRTALFRRDATFCARAGFRPGSVSLESVNFPGFFLRHVGDQMWLDQFDGSAGFRADSSFLVRPPVN